MSKQPLTMRRFGVIVLSYLLLCVGGGVVFAAMFLPAVVGANTLIKSAIPTLKVDGVDFDVTSLPQKSRLFAADGKTLIASFYAQNRIVVPLKDISKYMQHAVIAREDRRFFSHGGVDTYGVLRAFVQTYVKKSELQGGSSLTQQYVKNVLMSQARENDDPIGEYHASEDTIARKLREMLIAVQIEKKYSKSEILQGYLNIAQFGRDNLYGVEMAARRFFGISAKDLNIVQSATIAAITKNPAHFDPSVKENQEAAQQQRNIVLDLMLREHYISQKEHDEAKAIPLVDTLNLQNVSVFSGCQEAGDAAFFCDYAVKRFLNSKEFGATREQRRKLLYDGGLDLYSTLDLRVNAAAMKSARDTIPVNDPSGFEVSIAAIKPGTGEVLGFGSNRVYDTTDKSNSDPTHTAINYAVDQRDGGGIGWQVGSTWKPINLVAWFLANHSANEPLRNSTLYNQTTFSCRNYKFAGAWSIHNAFGGNVAVETPFQALIYSHNTTQASIAQKIGLCAIGDAAKTLGYHNAPIGKEDVFTKELFYPSMVIGAVQASPLTMANVFATIGANGVQCTPIAFTRIVDRSGKELRVPNAHCHQAIPSNIAQTVAYIMNQGVVRPGGAAALAQLKHNRKTFAKTGTNEDTYLLTGGFVPNQIAAFVAVGNAEKPESFNNRRINGVYRQSWFGLYTAVPAWREFLNTYLDEANIPIDNEYGQPDQKFLGNQLSQPSAQPLVAQRPVVPAPNNAEPAPEPQP